MRRWARAERELFCGYCSQRMIPKGDPVCYVKMEKLTRELRRCVDCAGPAPPDLPALVEKVFPEITGFTPLAQNRPKTRGELKQTAREWMPYREPGEDDE